MTDLIPSSHEVISILRSTGALRTGHFQLTSGIHTDHYLQIPLAMRDARIAKMLSVGLSRMLRTNTEIRARLTELSLVSTTIGGLPIAFGISEAIHAREVYWVEKEGSLPIRFRPYLEQERGEKVVIIDDVYRSGARISELRQVCEKNGAEVMAVATLVYQPSPDAPTVSDIPFFYLAKVNARYDLDAESCDQCQQDIPLETPWM